MKRLCPECGGARKIVEQFGMQPCDSEISICQCCGGTGWIDSWIKCNDKLPPRRDIYPDTSIWVDLCYQAPELKTDYFFWERARYSFASKKWYDTFDNEVFGTHWQQIEPPEEK